MKRPRSHRGVTLIEVLVAMVVITVVFLGLVGVQILSLRVTRDSQNASDATQLALETLTARTEVVQADFGTYQACPGESFCSGVVTRDGDSAAWAVSRPSGYLVDGLLLVDVQVTGRATARMATYVSCMDFEAEDGTTPTLLVLGVCEPVGP